MFSNKKIISIAVFTVAVALVGFCCVIALITGAAQPFILCFSVDSQELLYVGLDGRIEVYENGTIVNTISPQTSLGYVFTVQEDDTILLSTASEVFLLDLSGNVLDSWEDRGTQTYNQIQKQKKETISINGSQYTSECVLGWSRIVRNDSETVYRISALSFCIKVLTYITVLGLIALVIYVINGNEERKVSL